MGSERIAFAQKFAHREVAPVDVEKDMCKAEKIRIKNLGRTANFGAMLRFQILCR